MHHPVYPRNKNGRSVAIRQELSFPTTLTQEGRWCPAAECVQRRGPSDECQPGVCEVDCPPFKLGELRWLGIRPSPSYVGESECNGIMERWIRTLKKECLYLHDFQTLEEARQVIGEFIEEYNREWLIERHGHRTRPRSVRHTRERRPD